MKTNTASKRVPLFPTTAGEYLRILREEKGFKQSDVASWFDLKSIQYVSNIERDKVAFPAHWIAELSKRLKVPASEFRDRLLVRLEEDLDRRIKRRT